ncbi:hypothetical protein WR25_00981 [Diploscapter pachys]|uniref:Domain of unknown function DB domain-containing protein n=1 Tax=Diploscapter pachys TaxID=2018661 RepID=A0A2A2JW44_9BILA|nr:hypothetical protein WR25_00981 [Diploscapter pachys]
MAIGSELLIEMGRSGGRVTSGKDIGTSGGSGIGMRPPEDALARRGREDASFAERVIFRIFAGHRTANQKLKACCARQKSADKSCKRRFCDFEAINQYNVLHFLNLCSPKGDTVRQMWNCASSRVDHSKCCKKKKVSSLCMKYCDATKGSVPNDDLHRLFCLQNFNVIRDCFKEHLENSPNIFGDN